MVKPGLVNAGGWKSQNTAKTANFRVFAYKKGLAKVR